MNWPFRVHSLWSDTLLNLNWEGAWSILKLVARYCLLLKEGLTLSEERMGSGSGEWGKGRKPELELIYKMKSSFFKLKNGKKIPETRMDFTLNRHYPDACY